LITSITIGEYSLLLSVTVSDNTFDRLRF